MNSLIAERGIRKRQGALGILLVLLAAIVTGFGCGGGGGGSASAGPPPPPAITVTVSPANASIFLGQMQSFTGTVTGTTDTGVTWAVNGVIGGNSIVGTISTAGLYTAPQILPSPVTVAISAASVVDASSKGSADVTIASDVRVSVSPGTANVIIGGTQQFTALVTGSGNPNLAVTWSLSSKGCTGSACGSISATGSDAATYTAPGSILSAAISITATSVADPSQSVSASVSILAACSPPISISPSAVSIGLGQQQTFNATVCFTTNQNVNWFLSGPGCGTNVCGSISATGPNTAVYTAPPTLPPSNSFTLVVTSQADPTQSASATIALLSAVAIELAPSFASVAINRRQTFSASVQNSSNQDVTWAVNGVANGNSVFGQICQPGSNPCAPPAPSPASVDYLAPAAVPSSNPVMITATSVADPTHSASAEANVLAHVQVLVAPAYAFVGPSGDAQLTAFVVGSSNQAVTWALACSVSQCGSVTSSGLFTAPASAPSPNVIYVTATSQDDPTQSASAAVSVSDGVMIETLSPSSFTAGIAASFTLAVGGINFAPSSPGPGSTVLFNGAARNTVCLSSLSCSITIDPADAATPGSATIQIQNPDGKLSNPVPLVMMPPDKGPEVISLTANQPVMGGRDITVVESTAAPPLTIVFVGMLNSNGTICEVLGGPLILSRPASGSATFDLCIAGINFNSSLSYGLTGPTPNDVTVSSAQPPGGIATFSVTVSATTQSGGRTLFVTDPNLDRAAASGAIVIQ